MQSLRTGYSLRDPYGPRSGTHADLRVRRKNFLSQKTSRPMSLRSNRKAASVHTRYRCPITDRAADGATRAAAPPRLRCRVPRAVRLRRAPVALAVLGPAAIPGVGGLFCGASSHLLEQRGNAVRLRRTTRP